MSTVIELQQFRKSYEMGSAPVHALRGIDLRVEKGDFLGIMGPSGCGKSTLLHLLGCLDRPSNGVYLLNGQDVSLLDDDALSEIRSREIGFIFQSFNLIPQLTVLENVELPFSYQKEAKEDVRKRALSALERVGLSERIGHVPAELSGGERQRVAIARALVIDPVVVLADEPTGNLDSATGETILQLFQELNEQGVTLIVVTHDEKVGARCSRLIRMRDGAVLK